MPTPQPTKGIRWKLRQATDVVRRTLGMGGMIGDGAITGSVSGAGGVSVRVGVNEMHQKLGVPYHDVLLIIISSEAIAGGTFQWEYTCKFVQKTIVKYGVANWTGYGDAILAYNLAENINDDVSGSNPYGNGVNVDDLVAEGTFVLSAIPAQCIVTARPVVVEAATPSIEYWITGMGVPNGVTGTCT